MKPSGPAKSDDVQTTRNEEAADEDDDIISVRTVRQVLWPSFYSSTE